MNIDFLRRLSKTESKVLCCAEMELTPDRTGSSKHGVANVSILKAWQPDPCNRDSRAYGMGIRWVPQRIRDIRKGMLQGTEGIRPGY